MFVYKIRRTGLEVEDVKMEMVTFAFPTTVVGRSWFYVPFSPDQRRRGAAVVLGFNRLLGKPKSGRTIMNCKVSVDELAFEEYPPKWPVYLALFIWTKLQQLNDWLSLLFSPTSQTAKYRRTN